MSHVRTLPRRATTLATSLVLTAGLALPASGLAGTAPATTTTPATTALSTATETAELIRIAGPNRYATAASISQRWAPGVPVAYVANGAAYVDSTSAAARAGRDDAPVLLTRAEGLPTATVDALERLQPGRIVVVGNTSAVSGAVLDQLRDLTSGAVERRGGSDGYATAAAVASTYPSGVGRVYLATGATFPDALTGSAAAGFHGSPILFTRSGELPSATAAALKRLAPQQLVVLGGTAAVEESVARSAASHAGLTTWRRLGGANRYATAAKVQAELPDRGAVFVATGETFADSNTGGALAAMRGGPVLLVRPESVPAATSDVLAERVPQWVTVFGGEAAVSQSTAQSLVGATDGSGSTAPVTDPAGWTLRYSTDFSNLDGWTVREETQDNDNSRNLRKNVVAGPDGLTIHARRESGYNRPFTSGEIHGSSEALKVPNYFRAEVTAEVMDEKGLWPAALWFRPVAHSDGEIDVMEYMGGRPENLDRKRIAVTMHNEYGATQASLKDPIYIDQLTRDTVTGVHTYTIEKTPGQIKVWIDGDEEDASVFRAADASWWNRIMEVEGRQWYPRITLQVGAGARKQIVPNPSSSWQHSEMKIHSLKIWNMD